MSMETGSVVALIAAGAVIFAVALGSYEIIVRRRNPEIVLLVGAAAFGAILVAALPMIKGDVRVGPLLGRLAAETGAALALVGLVRMERKRRKRKREE
ncbi:MAG TPA: hypothetical protein VGK50_00985 [Coriobacteriia bacterium]